jgi:hypothetical protein
MVKIRVGYKLLEWYLDEVDGRVRKNIVKKEIGSNDVSKMPMTKYLFELMKAVGKWSERDEFKFSDWTTSLQLLKEAAQRDPTMSKSLCKPPPGGGNVDIQFAQAIDEMIIYSKTLEAKTNESNQEESSSAKFVVGILERQVKSEILRDSELLLPSVYQHREKKEFMELAAEYYLQSVQIKEMKSSYLESLKPSKKDENDEESQKRLANGVE